MSVLESSEHRNLMKVLDKLDKQVLLMDDD